MTPAIKAASTAKIRFFIHEYSHDPNCQSYGLEAAQKLGVAPERVFKTLIIDLSGELVVGIVPVASMLGLKDVAKAAGAKKAALADKAMAERTTGYILGGVSPLGQKKRLRTFIDESALAFSTIHVSAGRRGLEIELTPQDLAALTDGIFARLAQES